VRYKDSRITDMTTYKTMINMICIDHSKHVSSSLADVNVMRTDDSKCVIHHTR
jgi:hypothetical protein